MGWLITSIVGGLVEEVGSGGILGAMDRSVSAVGDQICEYQHVSLLSFEAGVI